MLWKNFENRRVPWYRTVGNMTLKVFAREKQQLVRAVSDGKDPAPVLKAGRKQWQSLYNTVYVNVAKPFAISTVGTLKHVSVTDVKADDAWLNTVLSYLRQNSGTRIRGIEGTTLNLVRSALAEGVAAGEGTDQLARRVADSYDLFGRYRAERIARTEVVGASNLGSRAGAESTGLRLVHEWLSTRDDRTRDIHMDVDGQKQAMADPYTVSGEELMFPGDGSLGASAENLINCRCTELFTAL